MWFVKNPTVSNGFVVNKPRGITVDGIQYPRNIFRLWSKAELAAIGVLPYSENNVDSRYHYAGLLTRTESNGEVVGAYEAIAKDVETLKEAMLASVKSQVSSLQGSIDWYWSRASKGGKAVPTEISEYAIALYAEMAVKEVSIEALTTLDDVIAFQNTPITETRYVKHTDDEGVETYGPETETFDREVDMSSYGWPVNPNEPVDPAKV